MTISELSEKNLENLLVLEEAYRQFPYKDKNGMLKIGIGRNLDSQGISRQEAMTMMHNDIVYIDGQLKNKLSFYDELDEVRKCVLIDMAMPFNLGVNGLLALKKMIHHLEFKAYASVASEMLLVIGTSNLVNERATRLANMMRTGNWQ